MPPAIPTNLQLYPVTISFSSPGARPPVFVAGDLTQPPWEPTEMDAYPIDDGEIVFKSVFHLPTGNYQYKFRLGRGDWWICDESADKIETNEGITNNRLVVSDTSRAPNPNYKMGDISQYPLSSQSSEYLAHESNHAATVTRILNKTRSSRIDPASSMKKAMHLDIEPTEKQVDTLKVRFEERARDPYAGVGDDDETPLEDPGTPLLPHEIGGPPPTPPEDSLAVQAKYSPILSLATYRGGRRASENLRKSRSNSIVPSSPTSEDLNDPNVERFPADKQSVLKRIQTLKHQLPEDETRELEAAISSEDDLSEADLRDVSIDPMPELSGGIGELGISTRSDTKLATRSHEHLEPVPEYDETDLTLRAEAGIESAGTENHQLNINEFRSELDEHRSCSRFAGSDGALDDYTTLDRGSFRPRGANSKTPLHDPMGQGDESEDEFDDACSESPLLVIKQVSFINRLWSRICTALGQFWRFVVEGFSKSKRE